MRKTTATWLIAHFLSFLSFTLLAQPGVLTEATFMPYFSGCSEYEYGSAEKRRCSDDKLISFIIRHLSYPEKARAGKIEGTIIVSFVIDENGEIILPAVLRDIGGGCGEAALNIVTNMPRWESGKQGDEAVKIRLNLPLHFSLQDENNRAADVYQISWGALSGNRVSKSLLKESFDKPLYVRDKLGNMKPVDELIFTFKRKKKMIRAKSRGEMTGELKKVVEKVKPGGIFTVLASVQDKGTFFYVDRVFETVER